jgi:hypothetical protein
MFSVTKKATTPFEGQKPGTSGLRKKVSLLPSPSLSLSLPDLPPRSWGSNLEISVSVMWVGFVLCSGASDPPRTTLGFLPRVA